MFSCYCSDFTSNDANIDVVTKVSTNLYSSTKYAHVQRNPSCNTCYAMKVTATFKHLIVFISSYD